MDRACFERNLKSLPSVKIAVFGDFFLDRYFVIDSELAELSIETGLVAHQVVGKRLTPGAAGTVVGNLRALGVGTVICLGVIGSDGEGFDLKRGLDLIGADSSYLIEREDRFTPCYTKPMLKKNGVERELERIDIKNRAPLPAEAEDGLLAGLESLLPELDAVIIADQVQERNFGVVTDRVRESLAEIAQRNPNKIFFADSRTRIGEFRSMIIKPNKFEAYEAVEGNSRDFADPTAPVFTLDEAKDAANKLRMRTGRLIFMTAQEDGIFVVDSDINHAPAVMVEGEIDPCGAGDSCTAGIVSALCAGASPADAALIGNLVASITVQKIGQTGTASPEELLIRYDEFVRQHN